MKGYIHIIKNVLLSTMAMGAMILSGCSQQNNEPQIEKAAAPKAQLPGGADSVVLIPIKLLEEEDPKLLWEMLPPSYQTDVTNLIHDFVNNMDQQLWDKLFEVLSQVGLLLKDKQDLITAMIEENLGGTGASQEEMQQSLETMGKMLQTLVESDLGKHATAKGMDPGKFLDETGKELFKLIAETSKLEEGDPWNTEIKAKLKDIKVEIVSQEGDTATISVSGIPDLPDIDELTAQLPGFDDSELPGLSMLRNGEQQVVKVEGKWIPKAMADEWKDNMSEASEMINNDLKNMLGPEEKKQVMNIMNAVQMGITGATKAKTQQELQMAMMQAVMGALMSAGGGEDGGLFQDGLGLPGFGDPDEENK
ncbi:MAG: hypothetical protein QGF29_13605 [Verrucomicrobiota bacterium]|jgi:hypothetical protein|nr:hypothetical protein [Verrucomicrobiota bacterium]